MKPIHMMLLALLAGGRMTTMADIEEAPYTVIEKDGAFELRDYAPQIVAEVIMDDFNDASSKAFRLLFDYISGDNKAQTEIAMTAPVTQEAASQTIAMTAPVSQEAIGDRWRFSFMMPATFTMATTPIPNNPKITLREIPARRMAAIRYSGRWTEKRYLDHKTKLETWVATKGFTPAGDAIWARYNAPFQLWFLRRNEVLIPVNRGP